MQLAKSIIEIFEYLLLIYFSVASIYVFFFALAGHAYRKIIRTKINRQRKIAVLIPAYREDDVIVDTAKRALQQNYPMKKFDVVVIGDSLQNETLDTLRALPVVLTEVFFEESTKAKALNRAMAMLKSNYDIALVLDADNVMEPDFLAKINAAFEAGHSIVQGHRKAKNLNTPFAILDAISEEVNNHIFRKGHSAIGLSSGLIGSGMAFDYNLFREIMKNIYAIGGFDKELEFELADRGHTIAYLDDAFVWDEKIQKPGDFSKQRRRWLSTQFVYLRKYFRKGFSRLFLRGNINFFDKLSQMVLPPRILLLGTTILITAFYLIWELVTGIATGNLSFYWSVVLSLTIGAFFLSIPGKFYNRRTIEAAFMLPSAFSRMFLLLFKMKGANKKFIHTSHGQQKA